MRQEAPPGAKLLISAPLMNNLAPRNALNLTSAKAGTLATLIASYSSPEGLFWAKLSAASLLAIAPIVVVGWFSQKQLVQGLTFGAVK